MARFRRRSDARSSEGRFLASRIQDARRRGATNREIGLAFGMNERTVRKIVAGETSGRNTFERIVERPRAISERTLERGGNPSIVRVDIRFLDANGNEMVRTVNARVPTVLQGNKRVTPTPADIFRIPKLAGLVQAEISRLENQYGSAVTPNSGHVQAMRPIMHRRKPLRIEISGYAT